MGDITACFYTDEYHLVEKENLMMKKRKKLLETEKIVDKQGREIVSHREIQSLFYNNFKWSIIYENGSLCSTPETNIIL